MSGLGEMLEATHSSRRAACPSIGYSASTTKHASAVHGDVIDFPRFSTRFAEEADLLVEVQRVFACLEEQDIGDGWVGYWHGVQPTSWGWDLGTPRWREFVSSSA